MKAIARTIRRDKNDAVYNLEKFDDEIAQLDQDLLQTNKKKKEALAAFDTVTKTILRMRSWKATNRRSTAFRESCKGRGGA